MVVVNSFAEHLIEGNLPNLKNWTQCKYHPVIQFHKFSKVLEKMELHDVIWKYFPLKNYQSSNTVVERK